MACRYNFCYVPKYYNGTGYLEKCTPNNGTTLPPYNGTTPPPPPNNTCPEEPPESDSACDSIQDVEECKYGELVIIVYITAMLVSYRFASVCNLGLLYLRLKKLFNILNNNWKTCFESCMILLKLYKLIKTSHKIYFTSHLKT